MSITRRKPADELRVPLNCLVKPATKTLLTTLQAETQQSQGEIVDEALNALAVGRTFAVAPAPTTKVKQPAPSGRCPRVEGELLKPKDRKKH